MQTLNWDSAFVCLDVLIASYWWGEAVYLWRSIKAICFIPLKVADSVRQRKVFKSKVVDGDSVKIVNWRRASVPGGDEAAASFCAPLDAAHCAQTSAVFQGTISPSSSTSCFSTVLSDWAPRCTVANRRTPYSHLLLPSSPLEASAVCIAPQANRWSKKSDGNKSILPKSGERETRKSQSCLWRSICEAQHGI